MSKSSAKPGPYGSVKFKAVDEYHAQFPEDVGVSWRSCVLLSLKQFLKRKR